jgi:ubiquinone/menaquinone biosynthesis C-methylase UbiE
MPDTMIWTRGYVSDVSYPAFFYKEMQPLWLATVARLQGFAAPDVTGAFALCELGCGVGVNLLVAAACHPQARFVGVDFNEDHLHAARDAAAATGIDNVEFVHADFATFARDSDRSFDFVTCHGVWSWIAPDDRSLVLETAARSLVPGGLLYLHYMCHPGSTELLPFQHLLNLCAHHMPGSSTRKTQTGMLLLEQIAQAGAFAERPALRRHLANMARRDPADLAHEFLTDHWQPQHSVDLHQQVGRSGLTYIGSADVFNNLDPALSVPGKMQGLVRRTAVPALAETLKDMARNAHQRMDLFQKDPRRQGEHAFAAALETIAFRALSGAPQSGPITFATPIGAITSPEAIFTPLLQRLAAGPASAAELARLPVFAGDTSALLQSLQLLMMQQFAHPSTSANEQTLDRAGKLSRWLVGHGVAMEVLADGATAVPLREAS